MNNFKWIKNIIGFLPAFLVLVLVTFSISNYQPKTFEAKVTEAKIPETTSKNFSETTLKETTKQVKKETTVALTTPNATIQNVTENENATYKDGNFTGTAQGFNGEVQVSVEIKNGKIKSIKCAKTQDDKPYFSKASALMSQMVKKQSTNVDVVSGATYSSNGIIGAVRNALSKAETSNSDTTKSETNKTSNKTSKKSTKNTKSVKGKFPYKNGVYYGTGEGYKGDIKVAVVIENKKIQYILIMENEDDKAYFYKARSIVAEIIKKQKVKVDTVSGATYSSNGILEAIKNALKDAKKKSNKKTTNKNTKTEQETTEVATTNVSESGSGVYKDGTYTVTGICKPNSHGGFEAYTMSAQISILNDRVIAISDIKGVGSDYSKSNDWYIKRAVNGTSKFRGVVAQIVGKGNPTSIDTVSGATCSSDTIIELVKKALEDAKNN